MTRSPTFSPAAETTTPPRTSGSAAPRPSPPGPTSPASPWLHNHAYRRASLSPSRFPSICRSQVDGAADGAAMACSSNASSSPAYSGATFGRGDILRNRKYPKAPAATARGAGGPTSVSKSIRISTAITNRKASAGLNRRTAVMTDHAAQVRRLLIGSCRVVLTLGHVARDGVKELLTGLAPRSALRRNSSSGGFYLS